MRLSTILKSDDINLISRHYEQKCHSDWNLGMKVNVILI